MNCLVGSNHSGIYNTEPVETYSDRILNLFENSAVLTRVSHFLCPSSFPFLSSYCFLMANQSRLHLKSYHLHSQGYHFSFPLLLYLSPSENGRHISLGDRRHRGSNLATACCVMGMAVSLSGLQFSYSFNGDSHFFQGTRVNDSLRSIQL